jgi:uncharacterized delta-60 repeat protein
MNAGATLQGPLPAWTKQIGARTTPESTISNAVASDPSGNIILAGYTGGDLGGNTLTGNRDFFVTKYNPSGTVLWTRQLGVASTNVNGNAVATDSSGNIFVTGDTTGGLDGNTLTGYQDFFVTKYDPTGTKIWTKQLGVAPNKTTKTYGVATDASGNILVAGVTTGGLDGNTLTGTQDFFVTKYNSSGAKQWTRQLGVASKNTSGNGVAIDPSDNIFVAGSTLGGLDGNTLTGSQDAFVTKYDSTGAKTWTKQLGALGPTTVQVNAAASDSSGNLYITGYTDGGLDGNTQSGVTDFFIIKYNSTGAKQWTRQLGTTNGDVTGTAIALDSSGNIYVTGDTDVGLDGNTLIGYNDFFVTRYDSSGTKQWTRELGVASRDTYAYGVATDSSGNVYVAGNTQGGLDGNTLTGGRDLFVTKYNSAGTKAWTRQLGATSSYITTQAVATDSSGNIFVAGYVDGGLDGNTLTGTQDFFFTKYNASGTKQWTRQLGVASKYTRASAVATDSSGNIFVAGYVNGGLDGNTLTGTYDFFVTKYDSTGTKIWTGQMGVTSKSTYAYAVATDSFGNVFLAGSSTGGLDGNALTGTTDFFVTKYTSTGLKQWTKQLGSSLSDTTAYGIAMHSSGRLYVVGTTTGGLDFNSKTGVYDSFACQFIGN